MNTANKIIKDDWNNELNIQFTVVSVPSLYMPPSGPKIFLGGSIDDIPDSPNMCHWREGTTEVIKRAWFDVEDNKDNITIYSPRREDDIWAIEMENEQATWDMSMLSMVDYIILNFIGDTLSPISLLELGIFVNDSRLYLSVDSSYKRKQIVELYNTYYGCNKVFDNISDSVYAIKNHWYNSEKRRR